jgi:hypothetical protein
MSTIAIIVTVLAFLVLAILASLAMIFRKINRTRTSRQSLCFDSLPDIFSADASDCTSHYQPSTAILDTTTSHTLHTLEAISSDSSCPMLVEEEEIDDSHLSPHWQPADSVIERDYEAVEDLNEDDYAEEIKTSPSCLSDMGDEEALAWAHSFMLRFNAAAAVLAATPGYDLECDDEYEEDEYHHPVSPVLESIAEENEQLSDEEDEVPHGDDGNLSLEWVGAYIVIVMLVSH